MVPQIQGKRRQFEDDGRTFEVIPFSGVNDKAGMQGDTEGLVLNQIAPEKTTVLFTRRYWCSAPSGGARCEVNHEFFDGIEEFLKLHEVEWWGTPNKMSEKANGHYFVPSKWSSDLIKLHPDDPDYDAASDPDIEK